MIQKIIQNANAIRLFLLSFTILYLELSIIRFTSEQVLYLGYFSNFILISVFLGMGTGFLLSEKRFSLFQFVPQTLLLLVAFVLITHIDAAFLRNNSGQLFFGIAETMPMKMPLWLCLAVLFLLTVLIFAGLGQETAHYFKMFKPLPAYSIDISGSMAGIVVFTMHAFRGASPVEWFATSIVLITVLSYRHSLFNAVTIGAGIFFLIIAAMPNHYTAWSPYQRIEVWPMKHSGEGIRGFHLSANGIGHQSMQPVGTQEPFYDFPYTDIAPLTKEKDFQDALIIGAGAGSDVAYAIHYGVKSIDAVEIDPEIMKAGQQFHPEKPYSDNRVHIVVNDGRAYMERTTKKYDLIIFALPDSLASLSNFANIRLESFLFTMESFDKAKSLLKDDGVIVLYNYYRKKWLVKKIASMLEKAFEHPPIVKTYSNERKGMVAALAIGPNLSGEPLENSGTTASTDNWPFLYMQTPQIPPMYVGVMLFFSICGLLAVFATGHGSLKNMKTNGTFFFLGAAFLLLETKSVIQFSLLFGATWLVNSLVFFAILASVLLANFLVQATNIKKPEFLYLFLILSIILQLIIPLKTLLTIESSPIRYLVASALLFSPIFFANLVFGYLFKESSKSTTAFGWNIIGTMMGGALEYSSIAIGYELLTILILILYLSCIGWTYWFPRPLTRIIPPTYSS